MIALLPRNPDWEAYGKHSRDIRLLAAPLAVIILRGQTIEQKIPGSLHKADMPDGCARAVEIGHRDVIQPSKTGGQ